MRTETRNRFIDEPTRALLRSALTTNSKVRPELPVLASIAETRHAWRVATAIATMADYEPHPNAPDQKFDAHHLAEAVQYVQGGQHIVLLALDLMERLGNQDEHAFVEYNGLTWSWSLGRRIRDVAIAYIDLYDIHDVDWSRASTIDAERLQTGRDGPKRPGRFVVCDNKARKSTNEGNGPCRRRKSTGRRGRNWTVRPNTRSKSRRTIRPTWPSSVGRCTSARTGTSRSTWSAAKPSPSLA